MKRIVIISDVQAPFEDKRALKNVIEFIGQYQPDEVIQIGDLVDYPAPSRWSAGTRAEFAGGVLRDSQYAVDNVLAPISAVFAGPKKILKGNHDERPEKYLASKAPALGHEDTAYRMETLLQLDQHGWELVEPYHRIAPGWVAIHGHESPGLNQVAGRTAASKARKAGVSVVMGHTHRLAVSPESTGFGGKLKTIYGFEVGHLMDVRKAGYLKNGPANWQRGFGLLYVGKYSATPHAIPVEDDGSFVVEGNRYGEIKRGPTGQFAQKAGR